MAQLIRVSLVGSMPGGEVWSVNPVFRLGVGPDVTVSAAQVAAIAAAINVRAVPTGILNMWTTTTLLTGCRVEARKLDGTLEALAEAARPANASGAAGAGHPYQTSVVSSLRTSFPGPRGRGRLYWPGTGLTIGTSDLRIATGAVTSLLSGVKTFLSGIETDIETTLGGASLAVWSRTIPQLNAVDSIQIGNVADVQRRRRDQLVESYQSTTYP